jgi:hypothetical protein
MATLQEASEGYVKLRNLKKKMQERHKEELAPINENMAKLEAFMLDQLNQLQLQNVKTATGETVYKTTRTSVKASDWAAFLDWVKENEAWEFLVRRPAESMVKEYLEEHEALPPGVSSSTEQKVGVRAN